MTIQSLAEQKLELKFATLSNIDEGIRYAREKISKNRDNRDVILALTISIQAFNELKAELKEFWGFK